MTFAIRPWGLAGIAACATATAFAGGEPPQTQRIDILASPAAVEAARELLAQRNLDAVYKMSSGRKLLISSADNGLQMQYGARDPAFVTHDGQGRFVTRDGRVQMWFEVRGDDAQQVTMRVPATWR